MCERPSDFRKLKKNFVFPLAEGQLQKRNHLSPLGEAPPLQWCIGVEWSLTIGCCKNRWLPGCGLNPFKCLPPSLLCHNQTWGIVLQEISFLRCLTVSGRDLYSVPSRPIWKESPYEVVTVRRGTESVLQRGTSEKAWTAGQASWVVALCLTSWALLCYTLNFSGLSLFFSIMKWTGPRGGCEKVYRSHSTPRGHHNCSLPFLQDTPLCFVEVRKIPVISEITCFLHGILLPIVSWEEIKQDRQA